MQLHRAIYILLAVLPLLIGCEAEVVQKAANEPIVLTLQLQQDSVYKYDIKNDISLTHQIDKENNINIHQNMTLSSAIKVESATSNQTDIMVTYNRITMSSGNQLFALEFDSELDDGTEAMYENLRQLIERPFNLSLSPTGKILSSQSIEVERNTFQSAYTFNDSSIRKVLQYAFNVYPKLAVKRGDSWQKKIKTSIGFTNIVARNVYQLMSIEDTIAHIEIRGKLTSENVDGNNSTVNITGTQKGSYDIDIKTGLVISGKLEQDLSGEMNITGDLTPVEIESRVYIIGSKK